MEIPCISKLSLLAWCFHKIQLSFIFTMQTNKEVFHCFPIIVNEGHPDYDLHSPILPEKGRYVVFMFVDKKAGNLEIEYRIIDRQQQELSRTAKLTPKGILK